MINQQLVFVINTLKYKAMLNLTINFQDLIL